MTYSINFLQPEPPRRPFDFSRYLLPERLVEILRDDPNVQAAFAAGLQKGEVNAAKSYQEQLNAMHAIFRDGLLNCGCPKCLERAAELPHDLTPRRETPHEGSAPEPKLSI